LGVTLENLIKIFGHALCGHSQKIETFLNIIDVAYQFVEIDFNYPQQDLTQYLKQNLTLQIPFIVDGDNIIYDSNTVLVYLARKYAPSYIPSNPIFEARVQKFLSFASSSAALELTSATLRRKYNSNVNFFLTKAILTKAFRNLEIHISGKNFMVNNTPSIADIAAYSVVACASEADIELSKFNNILKFIHNVEILKSFKQVKQVHNFNLMNL
jgi:glutathione S-transferase